MRWPLLLPPLLALAACGTPHYAGNGWDGRRGYDGNGDYGYDVNASRAEARSYRARASRHYVAPGTPDDPWGPYIVEAASRYAVPEQWIREVMRQESGGRLEAADGSLTTSGVGAMGLMQVMPATYDTLRRRYGLGSDPYEPHDNIAAGTAYIHEMYERFGAPAFLAAYNAGPDRLASYLAGNTELPDETVNYLARIAPRLGDQVAMTGPLSTYAAGGGAGRGRPRLYAASADRAYAGGGLVGSGRGAGSASGADAAYAGGGMSGVSYYSGERDRIAAADARSRPPPTLADVPLPPDPPARSIDDLRMAYAPAYAGSTAPAQSWARPVAYAPTAALVPVAAPGSAGSWGVQVGALPDPNASRDAAQTARSVAPQLAGARPSIEPVTRNGGVLYRARLTGLSAETATSACTTLIRRGVACLTVPPGA